MLHGGERLTAQKPSLGQHTHTRTHMNASTAQTHMHTAHTQTCIYAHPYAKDTHADKLTHTYCIHMHFAFTIYMHGSPLFILHYTHTVCPWCGVVFLLRELTCNMDLVQFVVDAPRYFLEMAPRQGLCTGLASEWHCLAAVSSPPLQTAYHASPTPFQLCQYHSPALSVCPQV
jgi:hypothetical protein